MDHFDMHLQDILVLQVVCKFKYTDIDDYC